MIQRDLGDGTYASYDKDVPPPVSVADATAESTNYRATCGHTAEQHSQQVRELMAEREPGLTTALALIAAEITAEKEN